MDSKPRVLVLGVARASLTEYVNALAPLAEVTVLMPKNRSAPSAPCSWRPHFANFRSTRDVVRQARKLHRKIGFTHVVTMYEFMILQAAEIRKALGIPGLRPSAARLVRDKVAMAVAFGKMGLPFPRSVFFAHRQPSAAVLRKARRARLRFPCLLKPSLGGANLGVRVVESPRHLEGMIAAATEAVGCNPFKNSGDFGDMRWLLSEYIEGLEFEAIIWAHQGKIRRVWVQQKTIVERVESRIYEVRMVYPVPQAVKRALGPTIARCLKQAVEVVWEKVAKTAGDENFIIYPEFRITSARRCYFMEIAYRIGGSDVIKRALGINVYDIAAAAVLGQNPQIATSSRRPRSVALQILYSYVPGQLLKIVGSESKPHIEAKELLKPGHKIKVSESEYVAFVYATGRRPESAERRLDNFLKKVSVVTRSVEGARRKDTVHKCPLRGS